MPGSQGNGHELHNITKFLLSAGSIVAAVVLFTAFNIPGVGQLVCPWCFGFERLEPGLFIEKGASENVRRAAVASLRNGKLVVGQFFGALQSDPAIFVCITDRCYLRAERRGGNTLGISFLDWVIVLSPHVRNELAYAHELTHTELHTRLGPRMFDVPVWFDEGLAVNVSDDPRYLAPHGSPTRCLAEPSKPMPLTGSAWVRATKNTNAPYAEAACLVNLWLDRRGGSGAVLQLISDIKAGVPFALAYGPHGKQQPPHA